MDTINDAKDYKDVLTALKSLGFEGNFEFNFYETDSNSESEAAHIRGILAGILHLGNVTFEKKSPGQDAVKIANEDGKYHFILAKRCNEATYRQHKGNKGMLRQLFLHYQYLVVFEIDGYFQYNC